MTAQRRRSLVGLVWGFVAVVVWLVVLTGCALGLGFVGHTLFTRYEDMFSFVGACGGLVAGGTVCQRAGSWVQWWRMRRMRRRGVTAVAQVQRLDARRTSGRGSNTRYTVRVGWDGFTGVRQYRFDGRGPVDFPSVVATGASVTVRYPGSGSTT